MKRPGEEVVTRAELSHRFNQALHLRCPSLGWRVRAKSGKAIEHQPRSPPVGLVRRLVAQNALQRRLGIFKLSHPAAAKGEVEVAVRILFDLRCLHVDAVGAVVRALLLQAIAHHPEPRCTLMQQRAALVALVRALLLLYDELCIRAVA
eukprot:7193291-Prymnesium_polylepis.1